MFTIHSRLPRLFTTNPTGFIVAMDVCAATRWKHLLSWAAVALVAGLAPFCTAAGAITMPGAVVDAQWLHAHLNEVTIIDVRSNPKTFTTPPRYSTGKDGKRHLVTVGGHIKGSHLVAWKDVRVPRDINQHQIDFMRPGAYAFQSLMQAAGVSSDEPIVVVSPSDGTSFAGSTGSLDMAARVYWTLKTFGAQDIAVLNGGLAGWLEAGYKVETKSILPLPGDWTAHKPDLQWTADSADTAAAIGDGVQLVDARPTQQFLGITKSGVVPKYGHIPGAHSFPVDALVRKHGIATYYMTKAEYKKILPELGINPVGRTITYCNTGHYAAGAWFVMSQIMGVSDAKLYDGSMLEWATEGRPVAP